MWTAAFLNIMLYIPIALVLRGVLAVSGGRVRVEGEHVVDRLLPGAAAVEACGSRLQTRFRPPCLV